MPSLLNTTVTANYLKTSPTTQFGTRALEFVSFTVSSGPDLTLQAKYLSAATSSSSAGLVVTTTTTAFLQVGMTVVVTAGTGAFAAGTTVTAINTGTTFTVSATPATTLSSATVSGYFGTNSTGGSYTDSNSYYSTLIRSLQQYAEIYAIGAPSSTAFTVVVATNTANDSAAGSNVSNSSFGDIIAILQDDLNGTAGTATFSYAIKSLVGATLS